MSLEGGDAKHHHHRDKLDAVDDSDNNCTVADHYFDMRAAAAG